MLKSFLNLTRVAQTPFKVQWPRVYTTFQHVPMYNFASFQDRLEKRQQKMSEQEFKKEIEFLVNKPSFTMADYKQRVIDGLVKMKKGIKAKLMSGNEATEASLMTQKKILNAMFDHELVDDTKLKGPLKKEVALVAQTTVEDVNVMIKNYEYLKSLHGWLKDLKDNGEALPASQDELTNRYRKDRPIKKSQIKAMMKSHKYSKRTLRQRIKWGPRKRV